MYIMLDSIYVTMSISTGLYPNLDLQNANELHYITLHYTIKHAVILKQPMISSFIFVRGVHSAHTKYAKKSTDSKDEFITTDFTEF